MYNIEFVYAIFKIFTVVSFYIVQMTQILNSQCLMSMVCQMCLKDWKVLNDLKAKK